jgi:hypothetical protein
MIERDQDVHLRIIGWYRPLGDVEGDRGQVAHNALDLVPIPCRARLWMADKSNLNRQ